MSLRLQDVVGEDTKNILKIIARLSEDTVMLMEKCLDENYRLSVTEVAVLLLVEDLFEDYPARLFSRTWGCTSDSVDELRCVISAIQTRIFHGWTDERLGNVIGHTIDYLMNEKVKFRTMSYRNRVRTLFVELMDYEKGVHHHS